MDVIENILGINLLNPKIYEFPFITNINSVTMSNIVYSMRSHQVNLVKSENLVSIYYILNLLYVAITKMDVIENILGIYLF